MAIIPQVITEDRASGALVIDGSLRFDRDGDDSWLSRSVGASGDRKTFTISHWIKDTQPGTGDGVVSITSKETTGYNNYCFIGEILSGTGKFRFSNAVSGSFGLSLTTEATFRDISAWGHFLVSVDTTAATDTDRFKFYWNGVEQEFHTTGYSRTFPTQNYDLQINNSSYTHGIGGDPQGAGGSRCYMAEVHFVDGQSLGPEHFGFTDPLTNTWRPKKYTGTHGTNGYYLDFSDPNNIGADKSGNGNNWTPNSFGVDDVVPDSPSGIAFSTDSTSGITTVSQRKPTNWCTLNSLNRAVNDLFDGNLVATRVSGTGFAGATGTLAASSGKWYYEVTASTAAGMIGMVASSWSVSQNSALWWNNATGYGFYGVNGNKYNNGSNSAYGSTWSANDVIGVAMDLDNGAIYFAINNTWKNSGDPTSGSSATGAAYSGISANEFTPVVYAQDAIEGDYPVTANFGQQPFKYAPPEGFKTLCTANLPRPTKAAVRPDKYFKTVLWTGNATDRDIDIGFQPDFVWIKHRSATENNNLYDSLRGATKRLESNSQDSEQTYADRLTSFNSNGFSLGTGYNNTSSTTYVGWCWKAGGAAVSNTDGSITSSVSANQDAGFSIVTWTGSQADGTVGHGLDKAPSLIIFKRYSYNGTSWPVYHSSIGPSNFVALNETTSSLSSGTLFGSTPTAPTSTVFSVGDNGGSNYDSMIAYCWSEVPGFSKFGSYEGNGNADGPFIHLGFKPKWFMLKRADVTGGDWVIMDNERSPINVMDDHLIANSDLSERVDSTETDMDFLSNGVKLRNSNNKINYNGQTFVYVAFAEAPTNNLFGGQANAR